MRGRGIILIGLGLLAGWILYANAWLVDDAYVTFRTVDHLVHGRGMVWNPGERVQAFTHPLWMLLVSGAYALTHELFYTVLLLSAGLASAAGVLAARVAGTGRVAFLLLGLASGKAIVDFASSGLEGPLSYLLAAWFLRELSGRARPGLLAALAALAFVNRADTILVYLPALAGVVLDARRAGRGRAALTGLALGALPALAWLAFATFYFGFPLPNTFYAKVSTGAPLLDRLARGLGYLANSWSWDTASQLVLVLATTLALRGSRPWPRRVVAGAWLYVGYAVLNACATHMSGRLFSLPLFVGTVIAAALLPPRWASRLALALVLYTALHPLAPWKMGTRLYRPLRADDSRADVAWLVHQQGSAPWPRRRVHRWTEQGEAFARSPRTLRLGGAWEAVGYFGLAAGPDKTLIDVVGLTDPLLARLPACNVDDPAHWKSGHFYREPPTGYLESRRSGENLVVDPPLHAYWERLRRVTHGPLLDGQRLRDIVHLNLVEPRAPAPPPPPGDCRNRVWQKREPD